MRIKIEQADEEAPVNLMPLIDMVFLLLIFFLVATTIAQKEREATVQLPASSTVEALSAEPKQLIINILQDGVLMVGGHDYNNAELEALVRQEVNKDASREVLIRADRDSKFLYYAEVVSLLRKAGVDKSKIGYIDEESKPQPIR